MYNRGMNGKMVFLHGSMVLMVYIFIRWMPLSTGLRSRAGGKYLWQYAYKDYRIDDGKTSALVETERRFHDSGISSFLSLYEQAIQPQVSRIVLMCIVGQFGACGGIGDRIYGIPYAVALALISGRQLILHPSLLSNGPSITNLTSGSHHRFLDSGCTHENVNSFKEATEETIYITVNCYPLDPSTLLLQQTQLTALRTIQEECSIPHLCGAAVIHQTDVFKDGIDIARRLIAALPMLQYRNYTALHVRAGGSNLMIDNYTTKALGWGDNYVSDVPQHWINAFRERPPSIFCQKHLAIVSDSVRLVSEVQFAAGDGLMITRCCSQPLHRDRTHRQEFFLQEIVDLFMLARSRKIIAGIGRFAVLGRYWLGRDGPEMVVAKTKEEIQRQMESIWHESDCATRE
jgi:hypothetical protein